ncbi:MAG: class I tRNA ligase family protein, partial [Parcubacteria group bacterium]|nr:class I tRNA ligase family protein [Parcubacteria group bacterium]
MFMGPFGEAIPWSVDGVKGVRRFLDRLWVVVDKIIADRDQLKDISGQSRLIHKTIKGVTEDIDNMKFNTAVSKLMIQLNGVDSQPDWRGKINDQGEWEEKKLDFAALEKLLVLLAPFAPHIAEELWEKIGNKESISQEKWPEYDPKMVKEDTIELVIQINGKVRDKMSVEVGITEKEALKLAKKSEKVKKYLEGGEIKKVIFVPDKLLSLVV